MDYAIGEIQDWIGLPVEVANLDGGRYAGGISSYGHFLEFAFSDPESQATGSTDRPDSNDCGRSGEIHRWSL